jgi:hypothetical protein
MTWGHEKYSVIVVKNDVIGYIRAVLLDRKMDGGRRVRIASMLGKNDVALPQKV